MTIQQKAIELFTSEDYANYDQNIFDFLEMLDDGGLPFERFPELVADFDPLGTAKDVVERFKEVYCMSD